MEQMAKFPDKFLPQATQALTFIRYQLRDLTQYCDCMLRDGLVNPQGFLELDNRLQKVLYETRAVCSPPPIIPKKSDFDVVRSVASGAFGTVSHVCHKQTRQSFAMKEIQRDQYQQDEVVMERDILTFLDHPLVVSMFCSFETERSQYMLMDYVRGGNFDNLLQKCTHLSLEASRFYAAELVLAVEYIHGFGIIHRDLKPENLLISSEGHLKLVDFGLSKLGSVATVDSVTAEKVAREFTDEENFGTPIYVAPELHLLAGYGKPIDWWTVGVILFDFLTGLMPFSGESMEEYTQQVINGDICWPENLSDEARHLLTRLLDTDPVTRLGTRGASEVKQHPFFKGVNWEHLLDETPPYVPELKDEDETSCSQMSPPPVLMEDQSGSPADAADFSYVAFRFKEVYGSQSPLSPITLLNRFPVAEMPGRSVEQQELDDWDEGFVDDKQQHNKWWEDNYEPTIEESGEEDYEPTVEYSGEEDYEPTVEYSGEEDYEPTVEESGVEDYESIVEYSGEEDYEPTVEYSGEEDYEPTVEESGEEDYDSTVEYSGEEDYEPTVEESGEEDYEPTIEQSGEEDYEPTIEQSGEEDHEPTIEQSGEEDHEPAIEESGEQIEPTVEASPPVMNSPIPLFRRNPVRRFFRRLARLEWHTRPGRNPTGRGRWPPTLDLFLPKVSVR